MKEAVLVYPHQIFEYHPCLRDGCIIFLIEEPLMFTHYRFHKQKLILHRASMKAYADLLAKNKYTVHYIDSTSLANTEDIAAILAEHGTTAVSFCDLVDDWLYTKLTRALTDKSISYTVHDTPLFLTTRTDMDSFFLPLIQANKKFLMKTFYEWQRKRLNILLDENGKPQGGKWSYDEDNRKKIPKGVTIPKNPERSRSLHVQEAKEYVDTHFSHYYGLYDDFFYPVTHEEAKVWLSQFLKEKLVSFGPYEDAVVRDESFLFHSVLSPLLNCGLLTPEYVIGETLAYAKMHTVPIASLEGFIRQIIGWREYMRAVYVYLGRKERSSNYFKATRKLPESFWTAGVGIAPIDDEINKALRYAYSHHIPRLMVLGNFMNLCGFEPDDVYQWFMEMYIDAYDWVMVPNVYSMALYADGGLITTKPYISGSAYILSMSDYKKGDWSVTWDGLFWNFVGKHFELLSKEGRLGFIGITYSKMPQEKKDIHRRNAEVFFARIDAEE